MDSELTISRVFRADFCSCVWCLTRVSDPDGFYPESDPTFKRKTGSRSDLREKKKNETEKVIDILIAFCQKILPENLSIRWFLNFDGQTEKSVENQIHVRLYLENWIRIRPHFKDWIWIQTPGPYCCDVEPRFVSGWGSSLGHNVVNLTDSFFLSQYFKLLRKWWSNYKSYPYLYPILIYIQYYEAKAGAACKLLLTL